MSSFDVQTEGILTLNQEGISLSDRKLRVLLIEDSPTAALYVEIWLQKGMPLQHLLHTATSLGEGLKIAAQGEVDIVVLDLNLPDSEGIETFRSLRSRFPNLPVVIMSADKEEETSLAAMREGAEDFIVKGSTDDNPLVRSIRFSLERANRNKIEAELRQTTRQIELARDLQQGLFPQDGVDLRAFQFAGHCQPAEKTGGDYYDFIPMRGGDWGVVVGDVTGHGLESSLRMIQTRAVLRTLIHSYSDVGAIVTMMNGIVCGDISDGKFVSLMLIKLDPESRSFRFVGAGHDGYLLAADGTLKKSLPSQQPPIGIEADLVFKSSDVCSIEPGDKLVLVTDGVADATNHSLEPFGEQRLFEVLRKSASLSAQETVDAIFTAVSQFTGDAAQHDDLTALVVKCKG